MIIGGRNAHNRNSERNAKLYGEEVCLVEINPEIKEKKASWKDYDLVETDPTMKYRREMTWREFDDKANRFANFYLKGV